MTHVDTPKGIWSDFRRSLLPAAGISLAMCLTAALATWDGANPPLINEILLCLLAFARATVMLTLGFTLLFFLERSKNQRTWSNHRLQ
jgi:hypothetical protein